jgi:hypothetical protein
VHLVVIARSRAELVSAGLIAYSHPLYQVLSLSKDSLRDVPATVYQQRPRPHSSSELVSIGHILRSATGGGK